MNVHQAYNFDDVHLIPRHSTLSGRMDTSIATRIGPLHLEVPLISAAMDTVTGEDMAVFMRSKGALGIIHRYMSIEDQVQILKNMAGTSPDLYGAETMAVSVGVNGDAWDRAVACVEAHASVVVLDVAHGDTDNALDFIEGLRKNYSDIIISSANIVTVDAARRSLEAGADVLRVGLGSGSVCETTDLTAVGYPQLSAVSEVHSAFPNVPILSDGGCRGPADVIKVLAAGASAVISGRLFAHYSKALKPGFYRGMASHAALLEYKGNGSHAPEGRTEEVVRTFNEDIEFAELVNHIKIGFSYLGALSLEGLQSKAEWVTA